MVRVISKQRALLDILGSSETTPRLKAAIILCSNDDLMCTLCACCLNLLQRSIPVPENELLKLKKFKKLVYQLANTKDSAGKKRHMLLKKIQKSSQLLNLLLPLVTKAVDSGQVVEKNE